MSDYEEYLVESEKMLVKMRELLRTSTPADAYALKRDDMRVAVVSTMLTEGVSAAQMIETLADTTLALCVALAEARSDGDDYAWGDGVHCDGCCCA